MSNLTTLTHQDYTVGWSCALPAEMAAARGMLDEGNQPLQQDPGDENNYTLGRIGAHNVVLACLPYGVTGLTSAASVAMQRRSSFKCLRFGLMVGIGGGVPSRENDIRLGAVVVSKSTEQSGGVIQYDFGKTVQDKRVSIGDPVPSIDGQATRTLAQSIALVAYPDLRRACSTSSSYSRSFVLIWQPETMRKRDVATDVKWVA